MLFRWAASISFNAPDDGVPLNMPEFWLPHLFPQSCFSFYMFSSLPHPMTHRDRDVIRSSMHVPFINITSHHLLFFKTNIFT